MMRKSYHADVVSVQQQLGELDLSTAVVTGLQLVFDICGTSL